jgi:hypothetical protein
VRRLHHSSSLQISVKRVLTIHEYQIQISHFIVQHVRFCLS